MSQSIVKLFGLKLPAIVDPHECACSIKISNPNKILKFFDTKRNLLLQPIFFYQSDKFRKG